MTQYLHSSNKDPVYSEVAMTQYLLSSDKDPVFT